MTKQLTYAIADVEPYINWLYYYHAWQTTDDGQQRRLRQEADQMLAQLARRYRCHARFALLPAYGDGDDIVVATDQPAGSAPPSASPAADGKGTAWLRLPMLRQQQAASRHLCLADFVKPAAAPVPGASPAAAPGVSPAAAPGVSPAAAPGASIAAVPGASIARPVPGGISAGVPADTIGLFATTVDPGLESDFDHDPYLKMMVQLLADRLAEATAELMHQQVRTTYWGYAPDEQLTIHQLHQELFQGIRPAVGYPSLPDASINFVLDRVLHFDTIGIRLTTSGAMKPHASVSGLMISHPKATYFAVGKIGHDQLADYARRRQLPPTLLRRFLAANLQ